MSKLEKILLSNRPESTELVPLYESEIGLDGKKKKVLKIKGTAVESEVVGINGRLYPRDIIKREADKFVKTRILEGRSGAELNHPRVDSDGNGKDGSIFEINLARVCAIIEELKMVNNSLKIKYRVTESGDRGLTTCGDILANLIEHGMRPGCSLRGAGGAYEHPKGHEIIADNYRLITVDVVGNPSFDTAAMLDTVYESVKNGSMLSNDVRILTESVDGGLNSQIFETASKEFIHQVNKNASIWSNKAKKELNAEVLLEYLNTVIG